MPRISQGRAALLGLPRGQRPDKVHQIPAVIIRKPLAKSWQARALITVGDPVEELGVGVNPRHRMRHEVGRARVERQPQL